MVPVERTDDSNLLESLVSKCPVLESLDLCVYLLSSLSIRAPKLQNLVLAGRLSGISLEESKQIKTLSLQASCDQEWDIMIKLFSCLAHVQKLLLGSSFWLSKGLREVSFGEKLKHSNESRQLKHLILDKVHDTVQSLVVVEDECCLNHLKCAKVCFNVHTSRTALQLIRLILLFSPVLELMIIEVREQVPTCRVQAEKMLNIATELLEHRRVSPNAKITIKAQPTNTPEY